ncbi:YdeI/OmpD-associated family protein [uncultured Alistipes sp.]|jgi:hypothetical protein|uniref:YdeI/OmpD-associated family protein n=1 Tax=uncultured Alistipes sp. TaxID=538949 RepID=UPI0025E2BC35|nr:YdeI/OmpD-associated family protein [uncultured Alistipes sp.]
MNNLKKFYTDDRAAWRSWLERNFETEKEVWFVFPLKASGKPGLSYNDAVEEALCFGWIDSIQKKLDDDHMIQWFTPRKNKKYYSQANRVRLKWLWENDLIHPKVKKEVKDVVREKFVFPPDIIARLKADREVWANYRNFSETYRQLRVGYINEGRRTPEEFEKRLANFINKTRANKIIPGKGGISKYY